jgi:ATP-dependent helicase HrpB
MPRCELPIDGFVDGIVAAVQRTRAAVVTAAPGAGKTTRIPPALTADGPVILLQPRRVAARTIAARIAAERGWTLGREVGWQVRFDRLAAADTRLLVVTEGILTARLQSDPLLSDFRTVVLDEFHERSIHGDLALALVRQAWRARDDLRIVVMSATLDAAPVSSFLDGCPTIDVPGRTFPLDVAYAPAESVEAAVQRLHRETGGNVLCFLPGAGDIRRTAANLSNLVDADVLPLHGSLTADEQDAAVRESKRRRVIVSTNIAETSLTVPGVTAVVDSGLHKVARYDPDRGIDSLAVERISAAAAEQRAGRAGRIAPGIVRRLWDARDRLRPHREPDIQRIDLSSAALDVIAWGGNPRTFEWFERPSAESLDAAMSLLERLGLVAGARLTSIGEQVRRLPLHPRLARMLAAARGARSVARACALLSERQYLPSNPATTASDLLSALDRWSEMPAHIDRSAEQIRRLSVQSTIHNPQSTIANPQSTIPNPQSTIDEDSEFRLAILHGYPDRVAQRRQPGSTSFLLASGTGAVLGRESGVRDAELIVALDVTNGAIRIASAIEREWLTPTAVETVHRFDAASGRVRASRIERYDALVLAEHPVAVDPQQAAPLLAAAWQERGPRDDDQRLLRRLDFAGVSVDLAELVQTAALDARSLEDIDLAAALPPAMMRALDIDAPLRLTVASGRSHPLEYHEDGSVSVAVKLQELFGLAETPRLGRRRVPVRLELLAPNGRPVQVTQDLRSFWERTYPDVRKELRGRYPKHPWPEDPWTASPSARTKKGQTKV